MAWDNSDITITDNTVTGACTAGKGYEECISVANTSVFTIRYNIVHDGFMEGIDAKDGVSGGKSTGMKSIIFPGLAFILMPGIPLAKKSTCTIILNADIGLASVESELPILWIL